MKTTYTYLEIYALLQQPILTCLSRTTNTIHKQQQFSQKHFPPETLHQETNRFLYVFYQLRPFYKYAILCYSYTTINNKHALHIFE